MSSHIPLKNRDRTRGELLAAFAPNLADLLDTAATWSSQAADAWVRSTAESIRSAADAYSNSPSAVRRKIEHRATIDCLEPLSRDRRCPPALREAIERHLRWRKRSLHLTAFKEKAVAAAGHFHPHPS